MEKKTQELNYQASEANSGTKPKKEKVSRLRKIVYGTIIAGATVAAAAGLYAAKEYNDYCKGMDELQGYGQIFQEMLRRTIEGTGQDIKEDPNK